MNNANLQGRFSSAGRMEMAADAEKAEPASQPPGPSATTLTLFDPVIVEEVPISLWKKVLAVTGYPRGLSVRSISHEKIVELAPHATDNHQLLSFIQVLHDLGTDEGSEAMLLAAKNAGVPTDDWPQNESARMRSVRLWLEQHKDERVRQVVLASQVHVVELGRRIPVHEFVGESVRKVPHRLKALEDAIREAMREACRLHQFGTHIEVHVRSDENEIVCHVVHSGRLAQPMAETKEGGRTLLAFHPVQADTVRYELATARLKIACSAASFVPSLQELFGRVLHGDANFFQSGEVCTLEPLQRDRAASLARHTVSTIVDAKLVQAGFRHGRYRYNFHGPDCLRHMEEIGVRAGEGQLYEGKIEIHFSGRKIDKRTVTVRPPNRIDFRRDSRERDIERYLEQIGVRIVAGQDRDQNLWTLYPWRHPLAKWRRALGGEVDRACRERILRPTALSLVSRPDRPNDPTPLQVVEAGRLRVGVAANLEGGPRLLSATDVEGLELDLAALTREIASTLDLQGGEMKLEHEGYVDLGKRSLGSAEIRVFLMAREPTVDRAAVGRRMRLTAGTASVVIIVPSGMTVGTGFIEVEQQAPGSGYEQILQTSVAQLRLESQVPAIDFAPRDRRLVVDELFGAAWLDRVPLAIKAGDQPFTMLAALAAANGNSVGKLQLATILSSARAAAKDLDGPKNVKARLLKAINISMKDAGKAPPNPSDILRQATGGGYRLCLPSWHRPSTAPR